MKDARADLETCPGCRAAPGADHGDWHGVDQRAEVARQLGWWTTAAGIDHLVEDYTKVLVAAALGQITWDPQAQRYAIGQIDEAAIDRAMRGNGR